MLEKLQIYLSKDKILKVAGQLKDIYKDPNEIRRQNRKKIFLKNKQMMFEGKDPVDINEFEVDANGQMIERQGTLHIPDEEILEDMNEAEVNTRRVLDDRPHLFSNDSEV